MVSILYNDIEKLQRDQWKSFIQLVMHEKKAD
jgi:hypothetical protein